MSQEEKIDVILFYRDGNNDKSWIDAKIDIKILAELYADEQKFDFLDPDSTSDTAMEIEHLGLNTEFLWSKTGFGYDDRFDHNYVSIQKIVDFETNKDKIVRYSQYMRKKEFVDSIKNK